MSNSNHIDMLKYIKMYIKSLFKIAENTKNFI